MKKQLMFIQYKNYYAVVMTISDKFDPRLSYSFRKRLVLSDNFHVCVFSSDDFRV